MCCYYNHIVLPSQFLMFEKVARVVLANYPGLELQIYRRGTDDGGGHRPEEWRAPRLTKTRMAGRAKLV